MDGLGVVGRTYAALGTPGLGEAMQGRAPQGRANRKEKKMDLSIVIQGTTPLLLNRFTDAAQQKATSGTSTSLTGDKGSPKEQAEQRLYVGIRGALMVPQPNLFRCLIDAGKYFKAGRGKVTTQKSSLIPACVEIHGAELPLQSKEGWSIDTRAVRIPATGGRILCHRPCFNDWSIAFNVTIDTDMIGEKLFREIVDAAGKRVGLGDFRPDCKGPFGKFVVARWEHLALDQAAE